MQDQVIMLKKTGEIVYMLPWAATAPRPWRDGYSRVVRPIANQTNCGNRAEVMIVRNDHLRTK